MRKVKLTMEQQISYLNSLKEGLKSAEKEGGEITTCNVIKKARQLHGFPKKEKYHNPTDLLNVIINECGYMRKGNNSSSRTLIKKQNVIDVGNVNLKERTTHNYLHEESKNISFEKGLKIDGAFPFTSSEDIERWMLTLTGAQIVLLADAVINYGLENDITVKISI